MEFVGFDTETFPIGPDAIIPKMVCASFRFEKKKRFVLSTADAELQPLLDRLFTPGNGITIVAHNAAYDVGVVCVNCPHLQTKIWDKLEAGEITCTMLREQLLNLGTHGKLDMFTAPDGTTKRIGYGLDDLVKKYRDIDISADKEGGDSWRKNFALLDGVKAADYPTAAYDYAADDADYAYEIKIEQDEAAPTDNARRNLEVATFHTAAASALFFVTARGMKTDEAEFNKLCTMLEMQLSDENMAPLINAGVMEPAMPPTPYKQDEKKAREVLAEWLDVLPEDVDFRRVDEPVSQALADLGIRIKAGTKASIKTKQLKRYVVALLVAKYTGKVTKAEIDALLEQFPTLEAIRAEADRLSIMVPETDTHDVSTAGEVIQGIADSHPVMQTYQSRQKLQKLVSTEIPRMMWDGKLASVVHFPFRTLLETGRTSSFASTLYPSANGQNVDPRARQVYVPRPGYALCSCDFSALELVCVAQTTYTLFGHSVHRDKIREGKDLHAYLGAKLAVEMSAQFQETIRREGLENLDQIYTLFKTLEEKEPKFYAFWRKLAKPVGLGFPSGLGAATMVELASKDPYNLDMISLAADRFISNPEEFDLKSMAYAAKKLHGMTKDNLAWTPLLKAVAFAMRLRSIWLMTYPEMDEYFTHIRGMTDESGDFYFPSKEKKELFNEMVIMWHEGGGLEGTGEPEPMPEDYGGTSYLAYTTPGGMHRAKCTYTAVSNGLCMQSPGAEGAKWAVIKTVRSSLDPASNSPLANGGGFVVNFVHDELLVELKEDELLHERAQAVRDLMERGLQEVIVDVPVKAEPCLMRKWDKYAKPVIKDGRLVVWEPKAK